jgi:hypothetical protein
VRYQAALRPVIYLNAWESIIPIGLDANFYF